MKCLSLKQPWAWAVISAGKDIENRTWRTRYRGPFLIHASQNYDPAGHEWIEKQVNMTIPEDLSKGGIIGRVNLLDCVEQSSSPWFMGPIVWVLQSPEPLPFIPYRGRLGLFEVSDDLIPGADV